MTWVTPLGSFSIASRIFCLAVLPDIEASRAELLGSRLRILELRPRRRYSAAPLAWVGRPPTSLVEYLRRHALDPLFTSCICVMELRHGAMRRADRGALWSRIEREILTRVEVLGLGSEESRPR